MSAPVAKQGCDTKLTVDMGRDKVHQLELLQKQYRNQ